MKLLWYIGKRLLYLFPVAIGVLLITFFIARILPTDPVLIMLPQQDLDPETIARVRSDLGLDQPIPVQFYMYSRDLLSGDFGRSWHTGNPVSDDLKRRLPATLELTLVSMFFTVVIAVPLGVIAAVRRDGPLDHISRIISMIGLALPTFWMGLIMIYFLFFVLGWFPAPFGQSPVGFQVDRATGFYTVDTLLAGDFRGFVTILHFLALPTITLVTVNLAHLTRMTRSSMGDVLGSEYIRAARAAGVPERTINYRLALKNALLLPITVMGLIFGNLINGVVVVEIIFAWPGLGLYAVNAAHAGDYAPVQAFALLSAVARVTIFLITDLAYFYIDPRIRY